MNVSELIEVLDGAAPDAEVEVCFKIDDGNGDYLLFMESDVACAEPYPGDGGRFLVHSTVTPKAIARSFFVHESVRELASALEREADEMQREEELGQEGC